MHPWSIYNRQHLTDVYCLLAIARVLGLIGWFRVSGGVVGLYIQYSRTGAVTVHAEHSEPP